MKKEERETTLQALAEKVRNGEELTQQEKELKEKLYRKYRKTQIFENIIFIYIGVCAAILVCLFVFNIFGRIFPTVSAGVWGMIDDTIQFWIDLFSWNW